MLGEYVVILDVDDRLLPHGIEANVVAVVVGPDVPLTSWFVLDLPLEQRSGPISFRPLARDCSPASASRRRIGATASTQVCLGGNGGKRHGGPPASVGLPA